MSMRGGIATKSDGSLWVWGSNRYGALGQNESGPNSNPYGSISSPTQIPGVWTNIYKTGTASNISYSEGYLAVKDDKFWIWGSALLQFNNLGGTSYTRYSSPVQVLGISTSSVYDAGTCPGPYGGYFIAKTTVS